MSLGLVLKPIGTLFFVQHDRVGSQGERSPQIASVAFDNAVFIGDAMLREWEVPASRVTEQDCPYPRSSRCAWRRVAGPVVLVGPDHAVHVG